jgi:hypothetical protein
MKKKGESVKATKKTASQAKKVIKKRAAKPPAMPPVVVTPDPEPKPILGTIPPEFVDRLKAGIAVGRYMLAVWTIENGLVHMHLVREKFPTADHAPAIKLLSNELTV